MFHVFMFHVFPLSPDHRRTPPGPLFYAILAPPPPQPPPQQTLPRAARRHRRARALPIRVHPRPSAVQSSSSCPVRAPSWIYETNPFRPPFASSFAPSRLRGSRSARHDETNPPLPPSSLLRASVPQWFIFLSAQIRGRPLPPFAIPPTPD